MPPDMRRGLRPAVRVDKDKGLSPWFELCSDHLWAKGRTGGIARLVNIGTGRAKPCLTSGGIAESGQGQLNSNTQSNGNAHLSGKCPTERQLNERNNYERH